MASGTTQSFMNRRRSLYRSMTRSWSSSPSSTSLSSPDTGNNRASFSLASPVTAAPLTLAHANDGTTNVHTPPVTHLKRTRSTVQKLLNRTQHRRVVSSISDSSSPSSTTIHSSGVPASSTSPSRLTPPSLEQVLEGTSAPPFTRATFTAFLSNNHCLESLEFYIDAKQYREEYSATVNGNELHIYSDGQRQQLCRSFKRIIAVYIRPSSPREINVPYDVRDTLLAYLDDLNQYNGSSSDTSIMPPSPDVFNVAVQRIYDLLDQSCFLPWINETMSKHRDQHQPLRQNEKAERDAGRPGGSDLEMEDTQRQSVDSKELLHMSSPALLFSSTSSNTSSSSFDTPNRADMYDLAGTIASIPLKPRRTHRNLPSSSSNNDFSPLSTPPDLSSSVSMTSSPSSSPIIAGSSIATDCMSRPSPSGLKGHRAAPTLDPFFEDQSHEPSEARLGEEHAETVMTPPTTPPSRHRSYIDPLAINCAQSFPQNVPFVPICDEEQHRHETRPHLLSWKGLKNSFRNMKSKHGCRAAKRSNSMPSQSRRTSVFQLSRPTVPFRLR